jgi:hypothetical protein
MRNVEQGSMIRPPLSGVISSWLMAAVGVAEAEDKEEVVGAEEKICSLVVEVEEEEALQEGQARIEGSLCYRMRWTMRNM